MTSAQFASLENAIQAWVDEVVEGDVGIDVVWGNRTVTHMAQAARSVLEACEESQDYGRREGLFI